MNECFHCHIGKEIPIETGCVDRLLLTRKNLSSLVDIKANTLYRHAKEVEANCKKALSLCMRNDSPYKNFNGTFPSGTNWMDYLCWIRKKMCNFGNSCDTLIEDKVNDDDNDDDIDDTNEAKWKDCCEKNGERRERICKGIGCSWE